MTRACPICKADTVDAWRPFCSKRCADVDLGRWIKGAYAIASTEEDSADEADLAAAPPRPDT